MPVCGGSCSRALCGLCLQRMGSCVQGKAEATKDTTNSTELAATASAAGTSTGAGGSAGAAAAGGSDSGRGGSSDDGAAVNLRFSVLPTGETELSLDEVATATRTDSAPLLRTAAAASDATPPPLTVPAVTAKPATDSSEPAAKPTDQKDVKSADVKSAANGTDSKAVKPLSGESNAKTSDSKSPDTQKNVKSDSKSDTKSQTKSQSESKSSAGLSAAERKALDETESFVLIPSVRGSNDGGYGYGYGGGGFSNQGNTCYLNSGLQCLLSCNRFLRVLRRTVKHTGKNSLSAKLNRLSTNPEAVRVCAFHTRCLLNLHLHVPIECSLYVQWCAGVVVWWWWWVVCTGFRTEFGGYERCGIETAGR